MERCHGHATASFVDETKFLSIMGSLATGVTIVASLTDDSQPLGMTCSAACSVSKDPPALLVCLHRQSQVLRSILRRQAFTVNVLCEGRQRLSSRASQTTPSPWRSALWSRSSAPEITRC